eukprot:2395654-Prorocentrum_lima.AAC.1
MGARVGATATGSTDPMRSARSAWLLAGLDIDRASNGRLSLGTSTPSSQRNRWTPEWMTLCAWQTRGLSGCT